MPGTLPCPLPQQGLAFFEQNKYGALVSITKSRGFLIRNLGTWKDGVPQWSAPVFLEMTTGGLGLSLGVWSVVVVVVRACFFVCGCHCVGLLLLLGWV